MFVSVAGRLTPEAEEELLKLEEQGALGSGLPQILRELFAARRQASLPSISEIARQSDLSAQTVKRLERLGGDPDYLHDPGVFRFYFPELWWAGRGVCEKTL